MTRTRILVVAALAATCLLGTSRLARPAADQEVGQFQIAHLPTSLAGEWLFRIGHDPGFASPFRERRNWQKIEVPGPWERHGYSGYNGHAWYRASLLISSELAREDFGLDLGVIGDVDEAFINGRRIGGTGTFPPQFEKATLVHRVYLVPRDVLRFGQLNEIAIHVFNGSRFGGLLGPAPVLDRSEPMLARAVARDIGAYSMATLFLTLAFLQLLLFASHREAPEHLTFAGFLVAVSVFIMTFTRWGPALVIGHRQNFRLHVVMLLLAVGLFPGIMFRLGLRASGRTILAFEAGFAVAAAAAAVWRDDTTLFAFIYLAEMAIVGLVVYALRFVVQMIRRHQPSATALFATTVVLAAATILDLLADCGILPHSHLVFGELFTPLALVPFSLTLSVALTFRWVERRWGEPLDPATGLMPRDRFVDRLGSEMARARRTNDPLGIALLRLSSGETSSDHELDRARAINVLRRALRQIDVLARYDHDTYAVLLTDTAEPGSVAIIERLRRAMAEGPVPGGPPKLCTSAGVTQYRPSRHGAAEDLLAETEAALYAAVNEGGNCTATAP